MGISFGTIVFVRASPRMFVVRDTGPVSLLGRDCLTGMDLF